MTEEYQKIYNDLVKKGFSEHQINLLLYPKNQNINLKKGSIIWSCDESFQDIGLNRFYDKENNKLYTYRKVI